MILLFFILLDIYFTSKIKCKNKYIIIFDDNDHDNISFNIDQEIQLYKLDNNENKFFRKLYYQNTKNTNQLKAISIDLIKKQNNNISLRNLKNFLLRNKNKIKYVEKNKRIILFRNNNKKIVKNNRKKKYTITHKNNNNNIKDKLWGLYRITQRESLTITKYIKNIKNQINNTFIQDGGKDIYVYIMDTGIHSNHTEFKNIQIKNNVCNEKNISGEDMIGHGTHVAGIVAGKTFGIAKKVHLINIKIFDENGETDTETAIHALNCISDYITKHTNNIYITIIK